jgi:hypothetical protein
MYMKIFNLHADKPKISRDGARPVSTGVRLIAALRATFSF